MGGLFGVELRQAGYDALVIKGRADTLSMICIDDGDIEIKSASAYAGKTSSDTERAVNDLWLKELKSSSSQGLSRPACP